jgi:flagellar biosynthesis component FlhA
MKKILKSLKWYFKHLNWIFALGFLILIMGVDIIDTHHVNWILFFGLLLFICIAPVYGIMRSKWQQEDAKHYKKQKEQEREQEKEEEVKKLVIEKLAQLENNELEDCPKGKKLAELMYENEKFRKLYEEHKKRPKDEQINS